ncbi:hypothetical protein BCV69DRAFT_301015 [Microstroma glucosiphilum]|uniref:Uncharacterized protein n=1 Tax=Pseudomicrostroma glucosiphilum TaxID=1684307 RepID=A0A316U0D3_9BASI|nr:hypothetical protein BCV69DRAFT_301015 [Pseudomicrostroma glucosiphilum]PWN18862.1 hypothetical protein BCV69DRAFT_301015 [Pseudomicrostroma glucosiphilum]
MHGRIRALSALAFAIVLSILPLLALASPLAKQDGRRDSAGGEYHMVRSVEDLEPEKRAGRQARIADDAAGRRERKRGMPWRDPGEGGGSMLDLVNNGLREPLNVILSSHSDPYILTDVGLRDYVRSIGFSFECLDLHIGELQRANLGDGRGWVEEMYEYRSTSGFGAPGRWVGACWESWEGGNHFRAWKQNGSEANTGAWFLAVSTEKNLQHHHTITPNGYDSGRDQLVRAALEGGKFGSRLWKADVQWIEGMLPRGSDGINHEIEIDGLVAVLTVQRYWTLPPTKPGKGASGEQSSEISSSATVTRTLVRLFKWTLNAG